MAMKTYPATVKDGKVYVEVTLRNVVEHNDVSDLPMLTEIKRLYSENDKLRTFIGLKDTCWKYVGWCDECPYNGVDDENDDCKCTVQERINSLARELGIEVPE